METEKDEMEPLNLWNPAAFEQGVPYDYFRYLRDHEPVTWHSHPVWDGFWSVTRHADVLRVSRDTECFSSQPNPFMAGDQPPSSTDDATSGMLISLDPPDHTKMRKLINRGFTPRRVRDLEGKIQATVDRLIDQVADKSGCEMAGDIAVELPLQVIADLVGVPEEDRHKIFHWTETTFGFDERFTDEERQQASLNMFAYADQMCEIRKKVPHDDLISVLMEAEIDGESLDQLQIDVFFMLLQNAGSETTRNLITTGTLELIRHPEQMQMLKDDPSLIPNAIEELLRYTTPVMQFVRRPRYDTVIGEQEIKAGDPVVLWYSSANRDERAFDDPDTLDITRDASQHVAFGAGGPHFCLGASLARLESKMMFEAIVGRFEGLALGVDDPGTLPRLHSNLIDGYAQLPLRWESVKPAA
ncbi:cytochrome P450 [Candidatus Poriferisocius sp.]|uniref:cytochrome P450 n=1 Tax=Candidatus Poriferisocius sp. TaxID=3101276 RepID=UPI003B5A77BD